MKTKALYFMWLAMLAGTFLMAGCKKDENDTDNDTAQASDFARAEQIFNDVADIADEAGTTGGVGMKGGDATSLLSQCATVTVDTISVPHLITIDFGTVNCLCSDGKYRRGIILVSFTGHFIDSLATHTVTFNNYFVNDNQVTGTKTVTNNGHNTAGHLTFTISVNGSVILANNAGTLGWISNRTREWVDGESTPQRWDDTFLISGNATVTHVNGNTSSMTITTPLYIERDCQFHYPLSGVVEIQPANKPLRTLDYSYLNSQCDKVATVTILGIAYNITLP
ncbi:MAG TPA: hypothetical protein P5531_03035 [Bacteroidales bacterium]|nr:hypothetical protein [Bacteroidales bacterium]HSA42507.1 hypothetical protein [Bacteroidales bacterium]